MNEDRARIRFATFSFVGNLQIKDIKTTISAGKATMAQNA